MCMHTPCHGSMTSRRRLEPPVGSPHWTCAAGTGKFQCCYSCRPYKVCSQHTRWTVYRAALGSREVKLHVFFPGLSSEAQLKRNTLSSKTGWCWQLVPHFVNITAPGVTKKEPEQSCRLEPNEKKKKKTDAITVFFPSPPHPWPRQHTCGYLGYFRHHLFTTALVDATPL